MVDVVCCEHRRGLVGALVVGHARRRTARRRQSTPTRDRDRTPRPIDRRPRPDGPSSDRRHGSPSSRAASWRSSAPRAAHRRAIAAPVTWTVTSLVAPSPPRTISRARWPATASSPSRSRGSSSRVIDDARLADASSEHAIVRRALAVHGDGVERLVDDAPQRAGEHGGFDLRIRRQKAEHRRHARLDHPGALRHAADGEHAVRRLDCDSARTSETGRSS